jgi:two-component sensor histidine kinase
MVCFGIATISEALRKALERAVEAERATDVLLRELSHRTRNNLATISTLLRLEANREPTANAKDALRSALSRIEVIAAAHDQLDHRASGTRVEMQEYLERLGRSLGDAHRGLRPISVRVAADHLEVAPEAAAALGLITNELVTNALKYGFPDGAGGSIDISLRELDSAHIELAVVDQGVGMQPDTPQGLGSTIVRLLVQQLEGRIEKTSTAHGFSVTITVPSRAAGVAIKESVPPP